MSGSAADEEAKSFFEQSIHETENMGRVNLPLPQDYREKLNSNIRTNFANKSVFDVRSGEDDPPANGLYVDERFPATLTSLIKHWNMADIVSQVEWKDFRWRRLSESFPRERLKIFDSVDPSDIHQGKLGDCYFLSTLSAIAEHPSRIEQLFLSSEIPDNGQYIVRLMDLGFWKNYTLDDYFPALDPAKAVDPAAKPDQPIQASPSAKDFFVFSGPKKTSEVVELWVCLLEKAWAKKYGSYYDIQSGFTDEALTDLTGAPCQTISRKSPRLWDKIVDADQKEYRLTGGCVGTGMALEDDAKYKKLGLVLDHAYAIISAKAANIAGRDERLLKIRNPWGEFEWSGDWGDSSEKWTDEAKAAFDFQGAGNDGTFWMSFDDFTKYFESVTICHYRDGFRNSSIAMDQTKDEEFSVVKVTVTEQTQVYLMVCQLDERRFGGFESGYQYAPVRIIAAQLREDGGLTYLDGKVSLYSRDAWLFLDVVPGDYLIYIEMNWKSSITDLFGVSAYASQAVVLEDVTSANTDFLSRCFTLDFVLSRADKTTIFETEWLNCYCLRLFGGKPSGELREGLYVDAYTNNSKDQRIVLTVRHDPWTNCKLLWPKDCKEPKEPNPKGTYQLQMEPGEGKVAIKKQQNLLEKHSFKMLMKRNFMAAGVPAS